MSYDELGKWKEQEEEITVLTGNLNHLIEHCLHNMGIKEYDEIQSKMAVLLEQGMFWLDNGNPHRFIYDLKEFTSWLCEYIADKEREFWGEE